LIVGRSIPNQPGRSGVRGRCVLALTVVVIAAAGLAGCGRKGGLDPPPGAALTEPVPAASGSAPYTPGSPQETAAKNGFDAQGNPVAPPGQKKSFILDPLLQ
jgi:predicted small lipoprotein YifL